MEIKQRKTISIDELIALDEERKLETKSDEKTKTTQIEAQTHNILNS